MTSYSGTVANMTPNASAAVVDRVVKRRRAVALARHYREFDGLAVRQIADRLGRSPATVKAYFYEPTGEKARTVQARCVGVSRACGAYTSRATARATRTRTANPATQARSGEAPSATLRAGHSGVRDRQTPRGWRLGTERISVPNRP
jgi:AraC-like DNA-binding protein